MLRAAVVITDPQWGDSVQRSIDGRTSVELCKSPNVLDRISVGCMVVRRMHTGAERLLGVAVDIERLSTSKLLVHTWPVNTPVPTRLGMGGIDSGEASWQKWGRRLFCFDRTVAPLGAMEISEGFYEYSRVPSRLPTLIGSKDVSVDNVRAVTEMLSGTRDVDGLVKLLGLIRSRLDRVLAEEIVPPMDERVRSE